MLDPADHDSALGPIHSGATRYNKSSAKAFYNVIGGVGSAGCTLAVGEFVWKRAAWQQEWRAGT